MEGKVSKKQLTKYIFYGVVENNISPKDISENTIAKIIRTYYDNTYYFQNYVKGELDTFKKATCLLLAINKVGITEDREANASIALDAAFKMCETPCIYTGKNVDEAEVLESIDFKKSFSTDQDTWDTSKETLVKDLASGKNDDLFSYSQNLELTYKIATQLKKVK